MTKLPTIILSLLIATGCYHTPYKGERWSCIGPQAALILQSLEKGFVENITEDSIMRLINELKATERILSTHPELEWYWKCRILRRLGLNDSARKCLKKALAFCDSAKHPYEWARIAQYRSLYEKDLTLRLDIATKALRYFNTVGDTFMSSTMHIDLAQIYRDFGDTANTNLSLNLGIAGFTRLGLGLWAAQIKLNLIPHYWGSGDTTYVRATLRTMGKDSSLMSNPDFRVAWWFDAWTYLDNREALDSLLEVAKLSNKLPTSRKGVIHLMEAFQQFSDSNIEEAHTYCLKALTYSTPGEDFELRYEIKNLLAKILIQKGDGGSAYLQQVQATALMDTIYRKATAQKIKAFNDKQNIEKHQINAEYEHQQRMLKSAIIGAGIIILLLCVTIWLTRRNARLRIATANGQIALERQRNLLAKAVQHMNEKQRAIRNLADQVEEALSGCDDDMPATKSHRRIASLNERGTRDFDGMRMMVEQVSSELIVSLKHQCPGISESMQQLAVLVSCGLNSKDIASIMNIQPDSVKKARYRLRTILHVPTGENLSDFLRRMYQ